MRALTENVSFSLSLFLLRCARKIKTGVGGQEILRDIAHPRHECATHKFDKNVVHLQMKHCANCWCYVCDLKAPCAHWAQHCGAYPCYKWDEARRRKLAGLPQAPGNVPPPEPRGFGFGGAGFDDGARRLVVHGVHVNHLAQINAFASNRDMDELRVLCPEGHHDLYRIRNKCEQLFLLLQYDGLGKNRYAVITRKSYELSHDGRFLSGSQNGQTRNATSEQVLRRLKEKDNGNWVYFPTSPQFQAAWKGALGGGNLGVSWWGIGYYKLNAPEQIYSGHFQKYDDIPEDRFPRSADDFDLYQKVFAQVQALVGGAPQQVANRDKPTTLIQHIARVKITEASDYNDKTKVYEVLAARACMRLVHKNESAYKNRIGEEPDGLISYVYPPVKVQLPDPAGIAEAFKIGTVSIPVRASKARGEEFTEERIAEELAKAPHGHRFIDKASCLYHQAYGTDVDLTNLFNYKPDAVYLTSRSASANRHPFKPFLEAMPIFLEGDPKPRSKVPLRILFVDVRNAKAEWTIYDVKNSDKVTNVIEDLEERYELNENEQIVLATVKYRPEIVTQVPFDRYYMNNPHHHAGAISDVTGIHNTEAERERRASTLPNYYRPFSRTRNDRKDNVEKILVAYKTKKAESFCIVHPMLKKTFKQRILPWQEHMNSKSEIIDEDDLKKVKELENGDYLQPCSIPIIIDAEGAATQNNNKKQFLRKVRAGEKYGDPKNINEYIRTCARHIHDWDEIEFPSSFTSEQRKNVHVSVQRLSVQRNSVLISTMSRTIGNERMVYLVKGKDVNVSKFGGIDVSTLLRQNTEPLLKACVKKYVSEESSRKRDRDGVKVKKEEVVTISHFLHDKVPHLGGKNNYKSLKDGLDKALTNKKQPLHPLSTPRHAQRRVEFPEIFVTNVTAIIEIDDESVGILAGVKRGLLPGCADSTAEAIEDLKHTEDIIDMQICECQAVERSQRMCAEIFTSSTTYFDRKGGYNAVGVEKRLEGFRTCKKEPVFCNQPEIRVAAKMRKQMHNKGREIWYLDVDIYARRPGTLADPKPYAHNFFQDLAYTPPPGWRMRLNVPVQALGLVAKVNEVRDMLAPPSLYNNFRKSGDHESYVVRRLRVTLPQLSKNASLKREASEVENCFKVGHGAAGAVGLMKALEMQEYPSVEQPTGLTVTMHDYQRQTLNRMLELERIPGGFRDLVWYDVSDVMKNASLDATEERWMYSPGFDQIAKIGCIPKTPRGGFLCEEMGLGKTIEVLALILAQKPPQGWIEHGETLGKAGAVADCSNMSNGTNVKKPYRSGATLVICAVSLVGQWIDEAKSKLDEDSGLRILMYHGQQRTKNPKKIAEDYDLVVTTYQTLAADRSRTNPLGQIEFYRLVCDESHMTKSYNTGQSKAASEICAVRRWACTGTPIATNSVDLFGQLAMLGVSPWGTDLKRFRDDFNNIICTNAGPRRYGRNDMTEKSSREIKNVLTVMKPMTIRHTKTQKLGRNATKDLLSLPPKTVIHVPVTLLPEEQRLYDELHADTKATWETKYKAKGHAHVAKRTFGIMSLLLPTRRLCSGGRLTTADLTIKEDEGAAAAEANGDAEGEGDNFEQRGVKRVKKEEEEEEAAPMVPNNGNEVESIEAESKLRVLVAELKKMRKDDPTNKALIFTQFAQTIEWLQKRLPDEGFGFRTISGSMSAKNRDKSIQAFQKDPPTTVFILSVRSGAVGINLTAASHVFMIEPCMNPALENQAIGRAWRMGQTRPVTVKILIVQDSIETNIVKLVQQCTTGTVAEKNDGENDGRPEIIDIEEEEENMRRAQMNKGELAGAIRADKQKLKLEEFDLLFSRGNLLPELPPEDEVPRAKPAPAVVVKDEPMEDAGPRIVGGMGFTRNDGNNNDNDDNNLENIGKDSQENKDIGSEENRQPLAKVQKRASLSETVQNAVGSMLEKFM